MWSDNRLQILELLLAALTRHDEELTTISNRLQEFTQLFNKRWDFPTETSGTEGLGNKMQRLEITPVEHNLVRLSRAHAKTFQTLSEERGMTILEVANVTHRSRATENLYLNHLVDIGFVEKAKKGRRYYFNRRIANLNRLIGSVQGPSSVMILTLVSKGVLEEPDRINLINNLSSLKDWKLERSVILSR